MKKIKIFIKRKIPKNIIEKYQAHITIYDHYFYLVLNISAIFVMVISENSFQRD